jgi:hypothetical protein
MEMEIVNSSLFSFPQNDEVHLILFKTNEDKVVAIVVQHYTSIAMTNIFLVSFTTPRSGFDQGVTIEDYKSINPQTRFDCSLCYGSLELNISLYRDFLFAVYLRFGDGPILEYPVIHASSAEGMSYGALFAGRRVTIEKLEIYKLDF